MKHKAEKKFKVWTYILQADGTFMVYSVTI